jgi:quercetin dioxygenase-like cupin family protein
LERPASRETQAREKLSSQVPGDKPAILPKGAFAGECSGPHRREIMQIGDIPFGTTDWAQVAETLHPGERGVARWRTREFGAIRVRVVEYSPGYLADHWCEKGHILYVLDGVLETELGDGRKVRLTPGMSYQVADGAQPHRSATATGARLFIVD